MSSHTPPKEADAFTPYLAPRNRIDSPKPKHIEDINDPIEPRRRYLGRERAVKTLALLVAAAASALLFLGFAVMVVEIFGAKRFIDWDCFRPIIVFAILDAMMLAGSCCFDSGRPGSAVGCSSSVRTWRTRWF